MTAPLAAALLTLAASLTLVGCKSAKQRGVPTTVARESLRSEVLDAVPRWVRAERLGRPAVAGARIFALSGCTTCHTYVGSGNRDLGARDLSAAGRRHGARYFARYVANPARFGNEVMPRSAALGPRKLHQLGVFLASSKGPH